MYIYNRTITETYENRLERRVRNPSWSSEWTAPPHRLPHVSSPWAEIELGMSVLHRTPHSRTALSHLCQCTLPNNHNPSLRLNQSLGCWSYLGKPCTPPDQSHPDKCRSHSVCIACFPADPDTHLLGTACSWGKHQRLGWFPGHRACKPWIC